MNEIKLLDTYGPDGPPLSDGTRNSARNRLLAEITATSTATRYGDGDWVSVPVTRRIASKLLRLPLFARLVLSGAAVTAMAVLAVTVLPRAPEVPGGPPVAGGEEPPPTLPSAGPIKLVAATALEFPYALPMLGEPSFTSGGADVIAVYKSADPVNDVLLWPETNPDESYFPTRDISVDGRPGHISFYHDDTSDMASLTWERRPGEWVTIVGNGRYGSEEAVLQLARQVVDQPQRVPFRIAIGLVPHGWELRGFKMDGAIVSYRDPAPPHLSLNVQWKPTPEWHPDSDVDGFEAGQDVTVDGRHARLVRTRDSWMLTTTLPDGSGFTLHVPRSFTPDQVIAVAESVRRGDS